MKIKICGLNPARDVQLCIDLKIDYLGFVFYEKSPRNFDLNNIQTLKNYDKKNSLFVAVTVNPSNEFIQNTVLNNFDFIQLHGSETCERVQENFSSMLRDSLFGIMFCFALGYGFFLFDSFKLRQIFS